jgi:hypothetical protein
MILNPVKGLYFERSVKVFGVFEVKGFSSYLSFFGDITVTDYYKVVVAIAS